MTHATCLACWLRRSAVGVCTGASSLYTQAIRMMCVFVIACGAQASAVADVEPVQLLSDHLKPDFGYGDWEAAVGSAKGAEVRLSGVSGQGGFGYNLNADLSKHLDASPALRVTLGAGNNAKSLRLLLVDRDGTQHRYSFVLPDTPGEHLLAPKEGASLRDPNTIAEPGTTEGLDVTGITQVQVMGDWRAEALDLTVHAILLQPEDDAFRVQRQARADARAAKAAAHQQAIKNALANLKRDAASPRVTHVAPVAPHILALTIQAGHIPPHGQAPYVAQPGDQIVPHKKHEAIVWRDGNLVVENEHYVLKRKVAGKTKTIGFITPDHQHVWAFDQVRGDPLLTILADRAAGYRVSSPDDDTFAEPVNPTAVYRKSKPSQHTYPNNGAAIRHRIYLELPSSLKPGKTYTVHLEGINTQQSTLSYTHDSKSVRSDAVSATQIGYRPDDAYKVAFLSTWLGTGGGLAYDIDRFELIDTLGRVVHTGDIVQTKALDATEKLKKEKDYAKTAVYAMDFSAFTTRGTYRVHVPGVGTSGPIAIADTAWEDAFLTSMQGFLHHRSGIALGPPITEYVRPRPFHSADGGRVFKIDVTKAGESKSVNDALRRLTDDGKKPRSEWPEHAPDAWGGYMDAGDWDRRTQHLEPTYLHLELLELFPGYFEQLALRVPNEERKNKLPDILDEAIWNTGLYLRTQTPDGGIHGGIESSAHPRMGEASWQESLAVGLFKPESESSYQFAATAAKLARVAKTYDASLADRYAESATRAWAWAATHEQATIEEAPMPGQMKALLQGLKQKASVELLWLTRDEAYAQTFASVSSLGEGEAPPDEAAAFTYARLPEGLGNADIKAAARQYILDRADTAIAFAKGSAYGLVNANPDLPIIGYVNYLSAPGAISQAVPRAHALTGDPQYLRATVQSANLSAGANPDNMTFTTGVGWNPPRNPLHIDSRITGQPAPVGITVYGQSDPSEPWGFNDWMHTWFLSKQMTPDSRSWPLYESYIDVGFWPAQNEYTVHQTMGPTSYTWGYLAARPAGE